MREREKLQLIFCIHCGILNSFLFLKIITVKNESFTQSLIYKFILDNWNLLYCKAPNINAIKLYFSTTCMSLLWAPILNITRETKTLTQGNVNSLNLDLQILTVYVQNILL